jgi:hypothetical protein
MILLICAIIFLEENIKDMMGLFLLLILELTQISPPPVFNAAGIAQSVQRLGCGLDN